MAKVSDPQTTDQQLSDQPVPLVPVIAPVIVKMGRQRPKRIRQLTKGRGRLLAKVMDTIAELQRNGTVLAGAQPVVVVVKERKQSLSIFN